MKKKRNFLTIISSILGCIAICGFSVFGLLSRSKENVHGVNADYEYNYDYVYRIDKYHAGFNDTWFQDIPPSQYQGKSIQYLLSYRFECLYGQNDLYRIKFSELSFNSLYAKYTSNYSYTSGVTYFNYNESSDYFVNDVYFDYDNYRSILVNLNNYINTYLSWSFDNNATYDLSLSLKVDVVQNGSVSPSNQYEFPIGTYNFAEYHSGSDVRFNFDVPFITNFNPYEVVGRIDTAIEQAYEDGVTGGAEENYDLGYNTGHNVGYQSGYIDGFNEADSQDEVAATIFSGILQVALVPINFFLSIFNFEILGINLKAFIQALFTVVLTIIVLKTVLGKGGGSSDN